MTQSLTQVLMQVQSMHPGVIRCNYSCSKGKSKNSMFRSEYLRTRTHATRLCVFMATCLMDISTATERFQHSLKYLNILNIYTKCSNLSRVGDRGSGIGDQPCGGIQGIHFLHLSSESLTSNQVPFLGQNANVGFAEILQESEIFESKKRT